MGLRVGAAAPSSGVTVVRLRAYYKQRS